jgi:hypothetical protein
MIRTSKISMRAWRRMFSALVLLFGDKQACTHNSTHACTTPAHKVNWDAGLGPDWANAS